MKKITAILFLSVFISGVYAAPAGNVSDPEVFAAKGAQRDYTGVFPENVKTIGVITPGSYPSAKNIRKSVKLLKKAGYILYTSRLFVTARKSLFYLSY